MPWLQSAVAVAKVGTGSLSIRRICVVLSAAGVATLGAVDVGVLDVGVAEGSSVG